MTAKPAPKLSQDQDLPVPALETNPKPARTAIKRCCAAWQRSYDAGLEGTDGGNMAKVRAGFHASSAYCKAMPPLAGYESIRDFIACTAHGILINTIPQKKASQLLYAAQVALASLHFEPKPRKSA